MDHRERSRTCNTRRAFVSVAMASLIAAIATGCSPSPSTPEPTATSPFKAPATVSELSFPVTISHRGGALVYPEESMEGFTASAEDGFLPEMDIQFLSDGTPVLIHDETADRTLKGASGEIRELSRKKWDQATITNPTDGPSAETVTLTELLDELGGEVVLVPEIKPGATTAEVDQILDEFDARDLQNSLIVQSFDFRTASTIAERGFTSLYLFDASLPKESPTQIADAGIDWVGPNRGLPAADIALLADAGLKVAPYGLKTAEDADALPEEVSGWFTDDPWDK
ncbi:glycerophosphodiester phosphodiesterase [Brevibacterium ammoniilyticum]|uniref:glycerophosphodiester phosphodiesterase n=1 Tax=Brevibacterium ammoniilyticum TaxID=1046555 RepID=UPI003139948F